MAKWKYSLLMVSGILWMAARYCHEIDVLDL
jgi:hypothetical protein